MELNFEKSYRVKSEKDFNAIFNDKQSVANKRFVIYKLDKRSKKHFRVGLSVSKNLGMQLSEIGLRGRFAMS